MDFIKIISICLLTGVCMAPVAQASETDYDNYVEGALQIYKQFQEPSVKESEKFLTFVNNRWKSDKETCVTKTCTEDGQSAALDYALAYKVKFADEF